MRASLANPTSHLLCTVLHLLTYRASGRARSKAAKAAHKARVAAATAAAVAKEAHARRHVRSSAQLRATRPLATPVLCPVPANEELNLRVPKLTKPARCGGRRVAGSRARTPPTPPLDGRPRVTLAWRRGYHDVEHVVETKSAPGTAQPNTSTGSSCRTEPRTRAGKATAALRTLIGVVDVGVSPVSPPFVTCPTSPFAPCMYMWTYRAVPRWLGWAP